MVTLVRRLSWLVAVALLSITPWAFAFGPLFPWSMIKPGYSCRGLARADIYYPTGAKLDPAYLQVDAFIAEAEAFHQLPMPARVRVIACANWSDFSRFSPLTPGRAIAAATFETGTVIFVSPKIAERGFDHGEFLRHEISHAIVNQNVSLWRQLTLRHYTWLFEGVPVWFGRQQAFVTQNEFLARARASDPASGLAPLFEFDANAAHPPAIDMRFAYIAWRDFLDFLTERRGPDTFHQFFKQVQIDPRNMRLLFERTYGQSLSGMVRDFDTAIRSGTYRPAP